MKYKLALVVIVVISLSLGLTGCFVTDTEWKATGGGYIEQCDGSKVTFGFNAQPTDDGLMMAKGEFQLVDHSTKPPTRIHGSFVLKGAVIDGTEDETAMYIGECSVNGEDGYVLEMGVRDLGEPGVGAEDGIQVLVVGPGGLYEYSGVLGGGNIQVHAEE